MGVITTTEEYKSSVSPARLFKALVSDSHILIPKLVPQSVKSIDFIKGDGGVGSIKQTTFPEGSHLKLLKHKIDELDASKFHCKYTLIEGDILGDVLEKVVYEVNFEPSGTGCVCKTSSHYHTKPGVEIKEEEIKTGKDTASPTDMYKLVEEYLIANPDVCA
ncbi:unnamed protein product [Ilex paraguariensis]|uniref:Bet v I/Major latex protein domain-containing protein n=1 Tax=Ilex paraguariensis TaxID=185542 RepID=A0ABC8QUL4_9AQUA